MYIYLQLGKRLILWPNIKSTMVQPSCVYWRHVSRNTTHYGNVGSISTHSLRLWFNINLTLFQRVVFARRLGWGCRGEGSWMIQCIGGGFTPGRRPASIVDPGSHRDRLHIYIHFLDVIVDHESGVPLRHSENRTTQSRTAMGM